MTQLASSVSAVPVVPTSPLQVELKFLLDVTPAEAFDLVANRLPEWFEAIHSVTWDHTKSTHAGVMGACSERSCDFGGKALKEVIASYEAGRQYAYRVDLERSEMKMPLEDHLGVFEVAARGPQTLVTWRQYFRPRWFVPGAMLRWQMGSRMMRPAVERLIAKHGGQWA